jgi:hypothetical protein
MSTIQDCTAEQLAKLFHHYREALANDCASDPRDNSSWEHTPADERKRLIAAARLTLLELSTAVPSATPGRKYFAKPGEADWGC